MRGPTMNQLIKENETDILMESAVTGVEPKGNVRSVLKPFKDRFKTKKPISKCQQIKFSNPRNRLDGRFRNDHKNALFVVVSAMRKKEISLPPHKYHPPCIKSGSQSEKTTPGKTPIYYNALPRDCKFAYMTPGYYATGFRILDVYKTEIDFSELRRLLFLEDSKQVQKWGTLRPRIPYAVGRVTDLPGTSDLNYKNYCLRSLTPESAASWRKSIAKVGNESHTAECSNEPDFVQK